MENEKILKFRERDSKDIKMFTVSFEYYDLADSKKLEILSILKSWVDSEVKKVNKSDNCATIQALKKENEEKDKCLGEIMNLCIGDAAMGYRIDGELVGQMIYKATGKNAEQFRNPTKAES